MIYLGLDPGVHGGIAAITETGACCYVIAMPPTDLDIWATFDTLLQSYGLMRAALEKVRSSPQMGVASAFTFGGQYRALRMALTAAHIPFDEVTPVRWQRTLECFTEGDKNVTKLRAQQLFPDVKVTHAVADALLLAEYCRRVNLRHDDSAPVR